MKRRRPAVVYLLQTFTLFYFFIWIGLIMKEINELAGQKVLQPQKLLYYWGPDETYEYLKSNTPVTRLFATRAQLKQWMLRYILSFGFYRFPAESRGLVFGAPPNYAKFFWG